jgi:2-keto-4-pentenoate hydratase/2-oxohepta-3-ene-1,7-dioic acid hydratase in catechol pathway
MRLASFEREGSSRLGVLINDGELIDVSRVAPLDGSLPISLMRQAIIQWEVVAPRFLDAVANSSATTYTLEALSLSPVVPDPSKVIAAPVNYIDHMDEMSQDAHIDALGVFLKAPSSVIGHGGTVMLPYHDRRFDQEGELAVVIGRRASKIGVHEVDDVIFGYLPLLDITMRGGEDRSTRKSFDTFTPIGPAIVTKDEIHDYRSMTLRCSVNGNERQHAKVADLIWGIPELVSYASSVMTLEPGDIVTTGTPAGVGPIEAGDDVVVELDGLLPLRVQVAADGAIASPTRGANRGPVPPPPPSGER